MINIDLQNKIFHIKEPTNKDEYEYLESEVLIMVGAFLNYQETLFDKQVDTNEILHLIESAKDFSLVCAKRKGA
ncbi:hypothetical protein ACRE1U_00950 [Helicobacter himalayensis]|uniref:hypothetical protein n=1 Tax=Helicobacter himalayensis TaxID=1591088 RepID=UPI003D6E0B0E